MMLLVAPTALVAADQSSGEVSKQDQVMEDNNNTLPDMTISDIYLYNNNILSIEVSNIGVGDVPTTEADSGTVFIWINQFNQPNWTYSWSTLDDTSFVNSGGVADVQPQLLIGMNYVKACVDVLDAIVESDENNNCLISNLTSVEHIDEPVDDNTHENNINDNSTDMGLPECPPGTSVFGTGAHVKLWLPNGFLNCYYIEQEHKNGPTFDENGMQTCPEGTSYYGTGSHVKLWLLNGGFVNCYILEGDGDKTLIDNSNTFEHDTLPPVILLSWWYVPANDYGYNSSSALLDDLLVESTGLLIDYCVNVIELVSHGDYPQVIIISPFAFNLSQNGEDIGPPVGVNPDDWAWDQLHGGYVIIGTAAAIGLTGATGGLALLIGAAGGAAGSGLYHGLIFLGCDNGGSDNDDDGGDDSGSDDDSGSGDDDDSNEDNGGGGDDDSNNNTVADDDSDDNIGDNTEESSGSPSSAMSSTTKVITDNPEATLVVGMGVALITGLFGNMIGRRRNDFLDLTGPVNGSRSALMDD